MEFICVAVVVKNDACSRWFKISNWLATRICVLIGQHNGQHKAITTPFHFSLLYKNKKSNQIVVKGQQSNQPIMLIKVKTNTTIIECLKRNPKLTIHNANALN